MTARSWLPEHRRDRPYLSLLELPCPCCERLIVPTIQCLACSKHSGAVRRYLVGWFCADCHLPVRVLRLYTTHDLASRFLATLEVAAQDGWRNGHPPDLPTWILPSLGFRRAATSDDHAQH